MSRGDVTLFLLWRKGNVKKSTEKTKALLGQGTIPGLVHPSFLVVLPSLVLATILWRAGLHSQVPSMSILATCLSLVSSRLPLLCAKAIHEHPLRDCGRSMRSCYYSVHGIVVSGA